ncbi:MAG: PEP-CTERM sorting domain-containing protein [Planctomycetota bacterium]
MKRLLATTSLALAIAVGGAPHAAAITIDSRNSEINIGIDMRASASSGLSIPQITIDANGTITDPTGPTDFPFAVDESVSFTPFPQDPNPPEPGTAGVDTDINYVDEVTLTPDGNQLVAMLEYFNDTSVNTTGSGLAEATSDASLTLVFTLSLEADYSLNGSNALDAGYDQPFVFKLSENGGAMVFDFAATDPLPGPELAGTLQPGTYTFEFFVAQDLSLSSPGSSSQVDALDAVFIVTTVPEPSSLALLGLGGLLIARRRR